jgi:hypothetical protein
MILTILCIGWAVNAAMLLWGWVDMRKNPGPDDGMFLLVVLMGLLPWVLPAVWAYYKVRSLSDKARGK